MKIHNLVQGSPEWQSFRLTHFGASEAAAMLGLSSKVKRNELLHMKATGLPKEYSEWVQANILDPGHEAEAMARPHIEERIGDDLFPVTCSEEGTRLSASCDGLTVDGAIAFEHKRFNIDLWDKVNAGVLPDEYMPQCQQILMVTGARKVLFVVSDGSPIKMAVLEIFPDPSWQDRIRKGWAQFEQDLAEYKPAPAAEPAPVGKAPETLPALRIEVAGHVTASNLPEFKAHALAVIGSINRELVTDQDFANAEKTVKWCGEVEERLAAAKQHALSQTASIDELFRTIDDISTEARRVRLELDKLVTARKQSIRTEIVNEAMGKFAAHLRALNDRLGRPYMPHVETDFQGVIKGKKTIDSLRNAVDTELARAKIAANQVADLIDANLRWLRENAADYTALFPDTATLVLKEPEALQAIAGQRIAEHKAAEARRAEELSARIREEQAKAAATQQMPSTAAFTVATPPAPLAVVPPTKEGEQPSVPLSVICARLQFTMTAAFVESLGIAATPVKNAKLYRESDFARICAALMAHISKVSMAQANEQKRAAA